MDPELRFDVEVLGPEEAFPVEYQHYFELFRDELIEVGNDPQGAEYLAKRLAEKYTKQQPFTEEEDEALIGLVAAIDVT